MKPVEYDIAAEASNLEEVLFGGFGSVFILGSRRMALCRYFIRRAYAAGRREERAKAKVWTKREWR